MKKKNAASVGPWVSCGVPWDSRGERRLGHVEGVVVVDCGEETGPIVRLRVYLRHDYLTQETEAIACDPAPPCVTCALGESANRLWAERRRR